MIQDMKVEEEIDPIHQDVVVVHDHPIVDPIVDPIVEMIVEEEVEDVHFLVHQWDVEVTVEEVIIDIHIIHLWAVEDMKEIIIVQERPDILNGKISKQKKKTIKKNFFL